MTVKEILNRVANGKSTVSVVNGVLVVKTKQWDKDTGTLSEPLKEHLNVAKLQRDKVQITKQLTDLTALLALVNL